METFDRLGPYDFFEFGLFGIVRHDGNRPAAALFDNPRRGLTRLPTWVPLEGVDDRLANFRRQRAMIGNHEIT